jgi:hypothetical protein
MDLIRDLLTVVVGVATGAMSGSFGVGGAVISTPAIRALGVSAQMAVGTTLPSILPGAMAGLWRYQNARLVHWRVVVATVPAGIVASVAGARLVHVLPGDGHPLMIATAILLGWSAINLVRPAPSDAGDDGTGGSAEPAAPGGRAVGIGAIAGAMSGLLGVGGGIVMVPMFRSWLGLPMKAATGTSLACVGFFAVPGTVTHALQGGIDWRVALLLTIGVVPAAPLGSRIALSLSDEKLRRVFGLFLGTIAVIYATGEIISLV